jgi:hypothetical protein
MDLRFGTSDDPILSEIWCKAVGDTAGNGRKTQGYQMLMVDVGGVVAQVQYARCDVARSRLFGHFTGLTSRPVGFSRQS